MRCRILGNRSAADRRACFKWVMSRNDLDKFKALFRMRDFFDAVPAAWERAQVDAMNDDEAVGRLLAAMNAHGRRPPEAMVVMFADHAEEFGLIAQLAVVFAVWKWFRSSAVGRVGLKVALDAAFAAREDAGRTVAPRLHVFRLGLDLAQAVSEPELGPVARRILQTQLGSALAPDDDPRRAAEGRTLLRAHLDDLRNAARDAEAAGARGLNLRVLRCDLAKALGNVGQSLETWAGRHDCDDPVARLEQALELHNEAMSFPERMEDPDDPYGRLASLRMRGVVQRHLAQRVDDPDRKLGLLQGALADAVAAHDVVLRSPKGTFGPGDGILLNVVNARCNLVAVQLDHKRISEASAKTEVRAIESLAAQVRGDGDARTPQKIEQMNATVERLKARVEGRVPTITAESLLRHAHAALSTAAADSRAIGVEPGAARGVIQALEASPDMLVVPGPGMSVLGGLFGYLDLTAIGPRLATRALRQEARLLARETGEVRDGFDPVEYVEQAFPGYEVRMCNPTWSHAERRIAAGWVAMLAGFRLDWAHAGTRPLDLLEEVRLSDLRGSTGWRSDLVFYGQGPVREEATTHEAGWRCYLYRTRWLRDHVENFLHAHELRELMSTLLGVEVPEPDSQFTRGAQLHPHGTPADVIRASTSAPEHLWERTADGIYVPVEMTSQSARADSTKLMAELGAAWADGARRGWCPVEVPDIPCPTSNEIGSWLEANPDAAVLSVGASVDAVLVGHGWSVRVPHSGATADLVASYFHARDEHSYGCGDDPHGVRAPNITDAERQERFARGVGTADATVKLEAALAAVLANLGAHYGPPLVQAAERGTRRLVILARSWARHVPWCAVPTAGTVVGDVFATAVVESLAPVARNRPRPGPSALYVGGNAGPGSSLALGKAVLTPLSTEVRGPSSRNELEAMASRASVLRVFAHGESFVLLTEASGIVLDEDDRKATNRFSVSEARSLDLRGVRRVELWACESGRGDVVYSRLQCHDEPNGMDAAVLLAGAECVVTSLWMQYVLSTAMIAEAFTLELAAHGQGEGEALGAAIRRYRSGLAPEGVFTFGVAAYVERHSSPHHLDRALRAGLDAWRDDLWMKTVGRAAPPLPPKLPIAGARLGPSTREKASGDDANTVVSQILKPYRSPVAWAGWKITVRSKESLKPWSEGQA